MLPSHLEKWFRIKAAYWRTNEILAVPYHDAEIFSTGTIFVANIYKFSNIDKIFGR